ncbi:MAG TPA: methylenetetrahydrofolate reductase [NAD(P)H] [Vicinamibacteria bacterium]|nr:methylenetetrahydrofolate reductase [NAD(P)H] [Vicinamibacteria bacterium]
MKRLARHPPHVSFEFFPPKTPAGWRKLKETAGRLAEFEPDFASVTFGAGGSGNIRTLEAAVGVRDVMGVDVVPHITCLGLTLEEVGTHLDSFAAAGFRRVLALRGDVPLLGEQTAAVVPIPAGGFRYANELVSFVRERGGFHILVSCYPEGHPEASSFRSDVDNFVKKVEAGADAAVTQYFFNNAAYFHFVDEVRDRGVDIPIVVGLMPIAPYEQVARFSEKCGADLPLWIRKRMEGYQDDPDSQFELAVEIAVNQAEELLRNGAPGIHFYTLNHPEATARICEHLRAQQVRHGIVWEDVALTDVEPPTAP